MLPLDDETRWILGRPNFACAGIAAKLRTQGHEIARKAEAEQAFVIWWMLCVYENHGTKWRDVAEEMLNPPASQAIVQSAPAAVIPKEQGETQ